MLNLYIVLKVALDYCKINSYYICFSKECRMYYSKQNAQIGLKNCKNISPNFWTVIRIFREVYNDAHIITFLYSRIINF